MDSIVMDWQQIISLMIVGVAALLLVRREIKRRQRAKLRACGHDCDCSIGQKAPGKVFEV